MNSIQRHSIIKNGLCGHANGSQFFGQTLKISATVCVVDQTNFIEGRTIGAQLGAGALLRKTPFV